MKHSILVVAALGLLASCEKAGSKTVADDLPAGEVRLIGAGVEPRAPLRYRVDKGTHAIMDMVVTVGIDAGGLPVPQLPTMKMAMDSTCIDVEPAGAMRFEVKIAEFSTDGGAPQMAAAMDMVKDMMKNMNYTFRLSPAGKIDDVQVTGLTGPMAQLGTQMKDSIEQFAAPLPEEPVGVGSTWKFKRTGEANGVTMATVNEFEMVALEGDVATFKVKGRVVAPAQTVNQNGVAAKVEKLDGTVTGTIATDLRRFTPSGSFAMALDMKMSAMGQTIKMKMKMGSEISIRP